MKPRLLSTARLSFPLATAIAALLSAQSASAATFYWDSTPTPADLGFGTAAGTWSSNSLTTGNGRWTTSATGIVAGSGSQVTANTDTFNFGTATNGLATGSITVGGTSGTPINVGSITFGAASGAITLNGGFLAFGASKTITVSNTTNTIGSVIQGSNGFNKNGSGELVLTGNLTHTGLTTVSNGGALTLSGDNSSMSGGISLSTNTSVSPRLNINSATAIGTGTLAFGGGAATDTVRIDNTSAGAITLSTNNVLTLNRNFTFVGTRDLNLGTGATTIGGVASGTNRSITVTANTLTLGGDIGEVATFSTGITKAGVGTLVLGGTNTYTNSTIVNNGTLRLAANNALGTGAFLQGGTGANTTTVDMNGTNQTVAGLAGNTVTTGSNTITNNGAIDSVLTLSGLTAERGSNFTITDGATNKVSLVLNQAIAANAQRLYFGSTYSGGTTLLAGRLNVENSNALGTAGVSLAGTDAQLRLAAGIAGTTTVTLPAGNSITVSDTGDNKVLAAYGTNINHVIEGGITINETTSGNFELQVGNTTTLTINGAITGTGGAGIRKTVLGTVVLNNTNNYTGTTLVSAGSLIINGAVASTTVTTDAYLGGRGVMANATVGGSGSVNPGNSPGIMTAAATDPSGGLDYNFEFTAEGAAPTWSNAAASVNDVLRLTSATPFTAALGATNQITLYLGVASLTEGDVFTGGFYTDNSADFLATINSAVFAYFLADAGGLTTYNGNTYTQYTGPLGFERATVLVGSANFAGGTINDGYVTQFTVIPEPNVAALFGGLGLLALLRRRRN